jgi:hypothetical protein
MIPLLVFFAVLFVYSLASRRLERTLVTAPIVFTVAGMLMFPSLAGIMKAGELRTSFSTLPKLA